MNDPQSERLRNEPTRLERLERKAPAPMQPRPVESKPAVSESVQENFDRRTEAIRRPGASS